MRIPVPSSIQIDASLHCQLACPLCPTADGRLHPTLGAGHLKLADFEALLERNPEIAQVELSNYGEMFLNPQLADILACAFEHKVDPGTYTVFIRPLGACGWMPVVSWSIQVAPRPICQQFALDGVGPTVPSGPPGSIEDLPLWIR